MATWQREGFEWHEDVGNEGGMARQMGVMVQLYIRLDWLKGTVLKAEE